jgi:hypothetical protein
MIDRSLKAQLVFDFALGLQPIVEFSTRLASSPFKELISSLSE